MFSRPYIPSRDEELTGIQYLRDRLLIEHCDRLAGRATMSDEDYACLVSSLRSLAPTHPILTTVGEAS